MTGIEELFGAAAAAAGTGTAATATAATATAATALTGVSAELAAAGAGLGTAAGTAATVVPAAAATTGAGLLGTIGSISPYLTLGSTLISALGSVAGGNQQSSALKYQQQVDKINAGSAAFTAEAQAQRQQIQSQRAVASSANTFGGLGIDPSSGSPLDVLADQAVQGTLDSEISRWKGQQQSSVYQNQATQAGYQAGQAQAAGDITAGTTLLTSGARYATSLLQPRAVRAGGVL